MKEVWVYDDQDGKWVSGYVASVKENESFMLVDEKGNLIGKYDFSLIKHLYDNEKK